ncbi:MAG: hypothetical protein E6R04_06600 [Spirochaetes bacterium]|nr:MAG: hypothetical protein E6R04_06600 [Spirochaetota bacterium]
MLKRIVTVFAVSLSALGMSACCRCTEHLSGDSSPVFTREELESSLLDTYRELGVVEVTCRGGLPRTSEVSKTCIEVYTSPNPSRKIHVTYDAKANLATDPPYLVDAEPIADESPGR